MDKEDLSLMVEYLKLIRRELRYIKPELYRLIVDTLFDRKGDNDNARRIR